MFGTERAWVSFAGALVGAIATGLVLTVAGFSGIAGLMGVMFGIPLGARAAVRLWDQRSR